MATCDQCHRRSAYDLGEWRADSDFHLCGLGAAYAECPDTREQFDMATDCQQARDRWQVARIAELEAANAALRAAIEDVREACETQALPTAAYSLEYVAAMNDRNRTLAGIAAMLPPKETP